MIKQPEVLYSWQFDMTPGVRLHSFVEIGYEIISTAILSLPLIHIGQFCQLLAIGCALSTG